MDGWMSEQKDIQRERLMDEWINGEQRDSWLDGWVGVQIYGVQ